MTLARRIGFVFIALGLFCLFSLIDKQDGPKADASQAVLQCDYARRFPDFPDPDLLKRVSRGFNLPNWDAARPDERPAPVLLDQLYRSGLRHIRLPFFHAGFIDHDLMAAPVQAYLARLGDQIQMLNRIGYAVSVDLHPHAAFNQLYRETPAVALERLIAIWQAVSRHLAPFKPSDVLLEILNEPDLDPVLWPSHVRRLTQELRRLFPLHTLVVGPALSQRHEALAALPLLDDPNILYAVHFYDPLIFTHQGADWHADEDPIKHFRQLPFPMSFDDRAVQSLYRSLLTEQKKDAAAFLATQLQTPSTDKNIEQAVGIMRQWSDTHRHMIIINEFGVLSHHSPRLSRLRWLNSVVRHAEANCIGWAHWDFSDGFGFVDNQSQKIDQSILNIFLHNDK